MPTAAPHLPAHPAIDAALSTAATLLGMEVVFLGGLTDETFTFERVHANASWPGIEAGAARDRSDSLCHRLLAGARSSTSDVPHDPDYSGARAGQDLGIHSYVGVPVRDSAGVVVATLCGIDRGSVEVGEGTLAVLRQLAEVIAAHLGPLAAEGVVIRRSPEGGWEVGGSQTQDLTSAMVLADLLATDLAPAGRPARAESPADELGQLRLSVTQLEHALAARVVVEQAIGVLTERSGSTPRDAFERLRKVARSRGRKVHDLAREVVRSASDPSVKLPDGLGSGR